MMKEVEHADRMSSSLASEVFSSIRMVVACGAEGKMAKGYAGWVQESRRRGLLMSSLVAMQQAPVFFAIHACVSNIPMRKPAIDIFDTGRSRCRSGTL